MSAIPPPELESSDDLVQRIKRQEASVESEVESILSEDVGEVVEEESSGDGDPGDGQESSGDIELEVETGSGSFEDESSGDDGSGDVADISEILGLDDDAEVTAVLEAPPTTTIPLPPITTVPILDFEVGMSFL